jgi:predicted Na+-dependent transporter
MLHPATFHRATINAPTFKLLTSLLQAIASRSLHVMAAGVFAGYFLPGAAELVGPALPYTLAGMMTIGIMRIASQDLVQTLSRGWVIAAIVAWLMVLSPILVWLVSSVLPISQTIAVALLLTAASPPLMSTVGLAWMLGLNPPLALAVIACATLLCPAVLALVLAMLPDTGLDLDPVGLFVRLALLIGGCSVCAALLRTTLGSARIARLGSIWDLLTVSLLLVFAVAVMDGVTARVTSEPAFVAKLLAVAFAMNLVMQILGSLFAHRLGASSALTVGYSSGSRAVGLLLAVSPGDASNDLVLFFALYQVPMYTLPSLLRPVYRRILVRTQATNPLT